MYYNIIKQRSAKTKGEFIHEKTMYRALKKAIEKTVIKSANTTSSFFSHQPSAPKGIEKFKKK